MVKLERRSVPPQGLLLAQRHSSGDAASSGQKHPHEDTSGCQDQPPRHNARYARHSRTSSSPPPKGAEPRFPSPPPTFHPHCCVSPAASDELKHIIGADTTRKGILRVFDMFQHQPMNRRLVYVFLEGFLETMFPQYKFPELFVKLHSRSPRIHRYSQRIKCSSLKR